MWLSTVAAPHVIVSVRSGELHTIVISQAVSRISSVSSNVEFVSLVLSLNSGCLFNVKIIKMYLYVHKSDLNVSYSAQAVLPSQASSSTRSIICPEFVS